MIALESYCVRLLSINRPQFSPETQSLGGSWKPLLLNCLRSGSASGLGSNLQSWHGEPMPLTRVLVPSLNLEVQPFCRVWGLEWGDGARKMKLVRRRGDKKKGVKKKGGNKKKRTKRRNGERERGGGKRLSRRVCPQGCAEAEIGELGEPGPRAGGGCRRAGGREQTQLSAGNKGRRAARTSRRQRLANERCRRGPRPAQPRPALASERRRPRPGPPCPPASPRLRDPRGGRRAGSGRAPGGRRGRKFLCPPSPASRSREQPRYPPGPAALGEERRERIAQRTEKEKPELSPRRRGR